MAVKLVTMFHFAACLLLGVLLFLLTENALLSALLFVFLFFLLTMLRDVGRNIYMICFLLACGLFWVSKPVAIDLFQYRNTHLFAIDAHANTVMYGSYILSFLALAAGYWFGNRTHGKRVSIAFLKVCGTGEYINRMQDISRILMILLYLLAVMENIDMLLQFKQHGYTASYIYYERSVPIMLHKLVQIAPITFAAFLATLPSKRKMIVPVSVFAIATGIKAMIGLRTDIMGAIMLWICYSILRNKIDGSEAFIKKRTLLLLVVLAPVGLAVLQFMSLWRSHLDVSGVGLNASTMLGFMAGPGTPAYLIGYGDMYRDMLRSRNVWYSFGRVWNAVHSNAIAAILNPTVIYQNQTVENALYGRSSGDAITYLLNPTAYVKGTGYGTTYVAELYLDFSYAGVVIGNLLFGCIMRKVKVLKKGEMINNFLCVFLFSYFIRIPRDTFDSFIVQFVGLKNIAMIILLHLLTLARFTNSKKHKG